MDICILLVFLLTFKPSKKHKISHEHNQQKLSCQTVIIHRIHNSQKGILPSHKNITGFFSSKYVIVFQDNLVCIPNNYSEFKPVWKNYIKEVL